MALHPRLPKYLVIILALMLTAVDQLMYEVKNSGKNNIRHIPIV